MTGMLPLTARQSWKALQVHRNDIGEQHLRTLFAADATRGERLTAEAVGIYLDYSKNRITDETVRLLCRLAEECGLRERIDAMFRGDKINVTENRAVLHVALRAPRATPFTTPRPISRTACGAARGRGTPASAFATSSTSGSAAPTSVL